MQNYRMILKKGEGTFSEVLKAQCLKTNKYVAIKCMKNNFDNVEQVTNLREIQALQRLSPHPNIVKLLEVLYDQPTGRLALVFELMDMNIYELIRGRRTYVSEDRVKIYMYQLIKAMDHMHRNGVFHRDIKPENILVMDEILKLADFGSCRGIYSKQPYTEYISTRWYRPPECLLTDGYYNYKMDMWGVGCVFFEIVSLFPLFPGNNELDQIQKIHKILGTPPQQLLDRIKRTSHQADFKFPPQDGTGIARLIPHASPSCVELMTKLLAYNPDDRLSARQALKHVYFKELREKEKFQQAFMNATSRSIRASPRLSIPETSISKTRAADTMRMPVANKSMNYGNIYDTNSSQPLSNGVSQLPPLYGFTKFREGEKDTSRSTPLSQFGDIISPTLHSVGSAMSMYASPTEIGSTYRDFDDENTDLSHGLPPIKGSYGHSIISPKISPTHFTMFQQTHQASPKARTGRGMKAVKSTTGHRTAFLEVSPKTSLGFYKLGDPPPKKRAHHKYVSPYSQRYMGQSTTLC